MDWNRMLHCWNDTEDAFSNVPKSQKEDSSEELTWHQSSRFRSCTSCRIQSVLGRFPWTEGISLLPVLSQGCCLCLSVHVCTCTHTHMVITVSVVLLETWFWDSRLRRTVLVLAGLLHILHPSSPLTLKFLMIQNSCSSRFTVLSSSFFPHDV